MYPSRLSPAALLAAGTLLLAACSDRPTSTQPDEQVSAASLPAQAADHARAGEQAFRELARQVPAFGGFYLNTKGELVVQLTDLSRGEAMRAALVPVLQQLAVERNNPGARLPKIVLQKAEYSFAQLSDWREQIGPITLTSARCTRSGRSRAWRTWRCAHPSSAPAREEVEEGAVPGTVEIRRTLL